MDAPQNLVPATRLLIGLLFVAVGLMPMLAAFDIGTLNQSDINGPSWLGFVAGGVFVLVGLTILAGPLPDLLNRVLAVVLMADLAAIGNWMATKTFVISTMTYRRHVSVGTGYETGERLCSKAVLSVRN